MNIAVVGAGPSGLVAAKFLVQHGYNCDVFEQTDGLGGNWMYKDSTELDKDGLVVVHSSMYSDLTTNVPKELMTYSDFSYPSDKVKSYISQAEVLEYLHSYADMFNIKKHIQYYKRVTKIRPVAGDKWFVTVQDVKTKIASSKQYHAVFICNGRYFYPFLPNICGANLFEGRQRHSRDFRAPKPFADLRILLIGGGISGKDISTRISGVAAHVYFSSRVPLNMNFPENVTEKPEVVRLTKNTAEFADESTEEIDEIIYSTGYQYECPFLTNACGVKVENNVVSPLYKDIINVKYPTMYFIGLCYVGSGNIVYDLQVRFAIAALQKKFQLPSTNEMMCEIKELMLSKKRRNVPKKHMQRLSNAAESKEYCQQLSNTANIAPVPPVIFCLYDRICTCQRKDIYKIIDDETYFESS